jgi:hypothetical protein
MKTRYSWDALPGEVRAAAELRLGPVDVVRDVGQGQSCNLALVLQSGIGDVFLKGVKGISPEMRWLRNEAETGRLTAGIAPSVRFQADVAADDDWLIVGFEYLGGRPANLARGSHDLGVVAETVERISALPGREAPSLSERWATADWWTKLGVHAPEKAAGWDLVEMTEWSQAAGPLTTGDALLHTDLHEHQFLITDGEPAARVIDWGRPACGAAWVDVAFLVIRLIAAGQTAQEAEEWARNFPIWKGADKEITAFACFVAGLWTYRLATTPFPGSTKLSEAAKKYARYRLADYS